MEELVGWAERSRKGNQMEEPTVTLELPSSLYAELHALAATRQTDVPTLLVQLVATSQDQRRDPVLELVGAYRSERPLIDNIPVSEDPTLYAIAEALGKRAIQMHAWELAPQRYVQGPDGQAIRRNAGVEQ
jgi:hypothetical protein